MTIIPIDASLALKIKGYSARDWLADAEEAPKDFILKTLQSLPLPSTIESREALYRAQTCVTRVMPKGLPNLGATCWFSSLSQALFNRAGPYRDALTERYDELSRNLQDRNLGLSDADQEKLHTEEFAQLKTEYMTSKYHIEKLRTLYDLSNMDLSDDIKLRCELNDLLFELIQNFFRDFYAVDIRIHQDIFEGLNYLEQFLDLGGRKTLIDRTELAVRNHLQPTDGTSQRFVSANSTIRYIDSPVALGSTSAALEASFMHPEIMDELVEDLDGSERKEALKTTFYTLQEEAEPPDILSFQILRFIFDRELLDFRKVTDDFTCSDFTDLPFYDQSGEHVVAFTQYLLDGIICHLGEEKAAGHYVFYKKVEGREPLTFDRYDDAHISRYVKGERNFDKHMQQIAENAYMVIYKKGRSYNRAQLSADHIERAPRLSSVLRRALRDLKPSKQSHTTKPRKALQVTPDSKTESNVRTLVSKTLKNQMFGFSVKIQILAISVLVAILAVIFRAQITRKD